MGTAVKLFQIMNTAQKCSKLCEFWLFVVVLKFAVGKRSESDAVCGQ